MLARDFSLGDEITPGDGAAQLSTLADRPTGGFSLLSDRPTDGNFSLLSERPDGRRLSGAGWAIVLAVVAVVAWLVLKRP